MVRRSILILIVSFLVHSHLSAQEIREYQTKKQFSDAIFDCICAISPAIRERDYERIFTACACGQLNVFLVYGGGEKVRQWVIEKNTDEAVPHVWWYPDAMDVVRVNRNKDIISPISL